MSEKVRELIHIAKQMIVMRDHYKRVYGRRWKAVSEPYRKLIRQAMEDADDDNPLSAVVPMANETVRRGNSSKLLLAVAVDMAEEVE